ncbi:MAG: hypothetical protein INR66_16775 [Gordonia polyisoprenivorans]|nr:hypothetical protein [Gordonia polyisoprenivorans]
MATMMIAAAVGMGGLAAVPATASAVSPINYGLSSWVDCGSVVCTKYWSKEKTRTIYDELDSTGWAVARVIDMGTNLLAEITNHSRQATLDGLETSATDAVNHGGCLQYAWRADGSGRGVYSWTDSPDYCGSEADRYDSVSAVA